MPLTQLSVDEGPHNRDGLVLHGRDETAQVTAFISRRVMDDWVDPRQPYGRRKSLFRKQYNALGTHNLPAIARIVTAKYDRGAAFNRQPSVRGRSALGHYGQWRSGRYRRLGVRRAP